MNKKTIVAVILVILIGLVGTILSISITLKGFNKYNKADDNIQDEPTIVEQNDNGENIEGIEEVADFDKDDEAVEFASEKGAVELTKVHANAVEEQVRRLYRDFKFAEATDLLLSSIRKYNVDESEHFETLRTLYMESALMHHISTKDSFDPDIISLAKNITDPENHMLATLFIEGSMRESLVHTSDSINPDFYGGVNVKGKKTLEVSDQIYKEAKLEDNEIKNVYEFEISIESYPLRAYIVESNKKTYFFKLIEEDAGSTPFYTFEEWRELEDKLNLR